MMASELHLLILEDDPYDARLAIAQLKAAGYECRWRRVVTQAEFVAALEIPMYDVILADYNLPEFDGLTALQLARERKLDTPFILVSGQMGEEIAIESLKAGATDYVLKDSLNRLGQVVRQALQAQQDSRQRKQAEEALRASEARHRFIFESVGVSIWDEDITALDAALADLKARGITDIRAYCDEHPEFVRQALQSIRVIDVNTETVKLFEAGSKSDLLAELDSIFLPESLPVFQDILAAVFNGQTYFEAENVYRTLRGNRLYELFRATILNSESDHRVLISITDITERRRAELELQHAKDITERANRIKSEFIATISHEIRTPLNIVLGFAQLFKHDMSLTEKQRTYINHIQRSGEHLLLLFNDILDISKFESDTYALKQSPFHLFNMLKRLIEMAYVQAWQKGVAFHYEKDATMPDIVYGDKQRLRQVLFNLIGNAVKFTQQGSVSLRVYPVNKFNELYEFNEFETQKLKNSKTQKLRFEVEDTGIGIPPKQLEQIFEPFGRVIDGQLYCDGPGLGLAISRRFVRKMGGELHVSSIVGQGSRFWFDLDLPSQAQENLKNAAYGDTEETDDWEESESFDEADVAALVPPAPQEVAHLYYLTENGDILEIQEWAAAFVGSDHEYSPFAAKLLRLAQAFEIKEIRRFLQPFMT